MVMTGSAFWKEARSLAEKKDNTAPMSSFELLPWMKMRSDVVLWSHSFSLDDLTRSDKRACWESSSEPPSWSW